MKIALLAAVIFFLSTISAAALGPPRGIIVIGESYSSPGFDPGTKRGFGWVQHLSAQLPVQITNLAIGGWGTAQQNALHLPGKLTGFYCGPGLATGCWGIIMVGFSDFDRTLEEYQMDLLTITVELLRIGIVHVVLVIEPVDHPKGGLTPEMRQVQLDLCEFELWSCVDFEWDLKHDFERLKDGTKAVHPKPRTHRRLAREVRQELGW